MEFTDLPIIDWELSMKLAGNKKELAEDMLSMLVNSLSTEVTTINQFHKEQNYKELHRLVHKLHGALCYCGLPRLKTVIAHLESELKRNIMIRLPSLLNQLNAEVSLLLEYYSPPIFKSSGSKKSRA